MRDEFLSFARSLGLRVDQIIDDGRVHRCRTDEKPTKDNGAYLFDGHSGWAQDWTIHTKAIAFRPAALPKPLSDHELWLAKERANIAKRELEALRRAAARAAQSKLNDCSVERHPYLERKGFPDASGMVDRDGVLCIPMRDMHDYKHVVSVQQIWPDGTKRFLEGGRTKGAIFTIGRGIEQWFVEGYATGLSVDAALRSIYRRAQVVVCFSAGNLEHVCDAVSGRSYVIADNDQSGTGEAAARATGLPWAMPGTIGMDANDLHASEGLEAVVALIQRASSRKGYATA